MKKTGKQTKSRINGSAELAEALVRCAGTGIYIVQDGKFQYVNLIFQELTGYAEKELQGVYSLDLVHPDDREAVRTKAIESLKGGNSLPCEYRLIKKSGEAMWVLERLTSTDYKGKRATVGSFMDITERKQSEETLAKSEERYRTIMDETHDDYFETDLAGNYTFVNDAICRSVGCTVEELIGKRYSVNTPGDDAKKIYKAFHQVYLTGQPTKALTFKFIRKDGSFGVGELSAFPTRNEKDEIVGFRGVSHDVSERVMMEEALRQSEARYRTIMDETNDDYYESDLVGNYTFVNDAMCRNTGYTAEELIGKKYTTMHSSDDVKKIYEVFRQVYLTGQPIKAFKTKFVRKDGSTGVSEQSGFPMRNEKGEMVGFRGVSHDVSERVRMEEALRRSEERYRTILEEIEEGYYETDLAGNITFVNKATCRQFGRSEKELVGLNYRSYVTKEDIKSIYKAWNKVYRTGEPLKAYPFATIRKDGTQIFLENSISPLRNKEGKIFGFRSVSRDVTERKHFEEKLANMATHDSLTGLPNRTLLNDRLAMGLALSRRSGNRLAVMMLDLDKFKVINDTMGHDAGDQLLKSVGERLATVTRRSDTIARMGGDEFVLVLPQVSQPANAATLAQRILDIFREPFVLDGHQLNVTTSIGIAVYPDDGKEAEILLKNADTAMYWSKEHGRDSYRFYSGDEAETCDKAQVAV
jgi:diguanylate cyclase (GGDEF)-like protein/PAS domain S-box-containing protein